MRRLSTRLRSAASMAAGSMTSGCATSAGGAAGDDPGATGLAVSAAPAAKASRLLAAAANARVSDFICTPRLFRRGRAADTLPRQGDIVDPQILVVGGVAVAFESHVQTVEARRREPAVFEIVAAAGVGHARASLHVGDRFAIDPELHLVRGHGHVPFDTGPAAHGQGAL